MNNLFDILPPDLINELGTKFYLNELEDNFETNIYALSPEKESETIVKLPTNFWNYWVDKRIEPRHSNELINSFSSPHIDTWKWYAYLS